MFCLRRPDHRQIRDYLARQRDLDFSYGPQKCTVHDAAHLRLPGWSIDRHRIALGHGEDVFHRARAALEAWRMFPPENTVVYGGEIPRPGGNVGVLFDARPFPLWLLMPARIVYVVDDSAQRDGRQIDRFGFAYGTLPDHPERGEERFLVEWCRDDDSVHYDLLAISRPRHWLARLAYPYTRWQQARFRRLSGVAMQRAVAVASPPVI